MITQYFAICDLLQVRYMQFSANCNLLRVRGGGAAWFWNVWNVFHPFLRKFLIRIHKKVSQKRVKNVPNVPSKKLQIQGRTAHAKNCGGE